MIVELIGKNKIYKTTIPNFPIGSYWICDENQKKLINIDGKDGQWKIKNSKSVKILDYKDRKKFNKHNLKKIEAFQEEEIILKEKQNYFVYLNTFDDIFILNCSPIVDDYLHLDIKKNADINIGSDKSNQIVFKNELVKNRHARIYNNSGILLIENYDNDFGTFINNKPVTERKRLVFNGDVIFIMGLKIIIVGKSIYISNPLGNVKYNEEYFRIHIEEKINEYDFLEEDDTNIEIYSEQSYFSRAPRITNIIEQETVKIDPPPQIEKYEKMPLIYILGSSMSMGLISMISMIQAVDGLKSGNATLKDTIFSLSMSIAMFLSMLMIPVFSARYEKKQKIKYEETRQKRYREYLAKKQKEINDIKHKQEKILYENYISAEECAEIIINRSSRLWERKTDDYDFLDIRLGMGDITLNINVEYPESQFSMQDDDLVDMLNEIASKSNVLNNAPIILPLVKKNIAALIQKDRRMQEKFLQNLLIQLVCFHSYEDVKLVFLLEKDVEKRYEHLKMLPHTWDNTKSIRFFADDIEDMKEISRYLEIELSNRLKVEDEADYKSFKPYYLIIMDNYTKIKGLPIIKNILKCKTNIGFGLFCLTDEITQLPNECKTFITLNNNKGMLFDGEISSKTKQEFYFDSSHTFFFERICKELSDIPIKYSAENARMMLPSSYNFLEMYDAGRIHELNVLQRWQNNDSTISLAAPIGIDSEGSLITLDIHEKAHGPHGLIAGSTGSGKSEFIITYILSLAINYHPDDVAFILIDYKGGGLAGAFQKKNAVLPHLVGTITNIDTNGLQRSLASIQSELKRRQRMFNEARNNTDEGTIDIYKYQKLYHEGVVKKPIPHLLIICDEFAELKQQQEDFMDELISVARIGRSLGVHLILATQKPAGIVNDQIRSNSKFGICLKVQDQEDSRDVIGRTDAASLKKAGQFYMQVGNNEYFVLGQSAWAGAEYYPSDTTKKKVDNSIDFISNIGQIIKKVDNTKKEKIKSDGEQLTGILKYMCNIAKEENIKSQPLWIENIPETIYIDKIREKYNINIDRKDIIATIGEFDDPNNQRQGPATIDISKGGNIIVYGNATSGKETLLSTLTYDLMTHFSPNDVQLYLFDFGTESLKIFKNSPNVADVVLMNDSEKIERFFEMIQKEIRKRIKLLSEYGGDYEYYISTSNEQMPTKLIIFNSYEVFAENYEDKYEDIFLSVTRDGSKCGIIFLITVSNPSDIRYRLSQNFKQKIALQLNSEDDYLNIWDEVKKKRPAQIFGRGLLKYEDIFEFQTAKICDAEDWNSRIKDTIRVLNEHTTIKAEPIPILPEKVKLQDLEQYITNIEDFPIGIQKDTLDVCKYNFKKKFVNIISSINIENSIGFIINLIKGLKTIENVKLEIIDPNYMIQNGKFNMNSVTKNFMLGIKNNLNKTKEIVTIIIGVDKFINEIENGEETFMNLLKEAEQSGNYSFIIFENAKKLKNLEYNDWYQEYITGDSGIWIGKGVTDQYLININSSNNINNKCNDSFGYIVENEEPKMFKVLGVELTNDNN